MQPAAPAPPAATAFVVWMAMLVAVLLHALVLAIVPARAGTAVEAVGTLRHLLTGLAVASTMAVWFIDRRYLVPALERVPRTSGSSLDPANAFTWYVTAWALGEAISLYGLVLGFLTQSLAAASPFFVWGFAVIAYLRPRAELFAR
jgi:hypothetical protein